MSAPVLSDYQIQIGSLVMGASTAYRITRVTGLGQPERRYGDVARPISDGDFMGSGYYSSRVVTIEMSLVAASASAATALLSALSLQWRGSATLYVRMPGWGTRAIPGQPRKLHADDRAWNRFGHIPVILEYYAPGSAMLGDIVTTGATPGVIGTFTFNFTFNITFGTATTGWVATAANGGDYNYAPTMRVVGPFTQAIVTRASDGATFTLNATLTSGQYASIDMDARTILRDDGTNLRRYLAAGSTWLTVPAGGDTFTLTPSGAHATETHLEIDSRDAWLA
jgi:hypothetical protein